MACLLRLGPLGIHRCLIPVSCGLKCFKICINLYIIIAMLFSAGRAPA